MSVEATAISLSNLEQSLNLGRKNYEVSGHVVDVSWKKFKPVASTGSDQSIFFFGGWPGGETRASLGGLCQAMSNISGSPTFSLYARSKDFGQFSAMQEAEAVSRFISDDAANQIVLSGHSLGGTKAIDVAYLLQHLNPKKQVNGLILFNSVGLYDTSELLLSVMSIIENLVSTPRALLTNSFIAKEVLQGYLDVILGIVSRLRTDRMSFPKRASAESKMACSLNPRLKDVTVPIVVLEGKNDLISDYSKVNGTAFGDNPKIKIVVGKKVGVHGFPLFQSEKAAKVGLYLLERESRVPLTNGS